MSNNNQSSLSGTTLACLTKENRGNNGSKYENWTCLCVKIPVDQPFVKNSLHQQRCLSSSFRCSVSASFSSSSTCLNKLGCCNVIGWLAICFNRLFVILPHQSCWVCVFLCVSLSVYDIIIIILSDLYSSVNFLWLFLVSLGYFWYYLKSLQQFDWQLGYFGSICFALGTS